MNLTIQGVQAGLAKKRRAPLNLNVRRQKSKTMEEEYMQGTTRGKIKFFLFLAGGLFLYLSLKYIWEVYLPAPIEDTEEAIRQYSHNVAHAIVTLSVFMFCIYIYLSIYFYKYGKFIKESEQYPPPDTDIPFTKKIVRGEKALKQARASFIGSGLMIFIGLAKIGVSIYSAIVLYELTNAF